MDVRRLYPFLNEKDELDYLRESKSGNGGKNGWMALYPSSNAPGWSQRGGGGGRYNHGSKSASNIMIPRNIVLDDCDQRNQIMSLGLTKCSYSKNKNNATSNIGIHNS